MVQLPECLRESNQHSSGGEFIASNGRVGYALIKR